MKVRNQFNYQITKGKNITMPSQTIPDQTMSIKTILERYSKGLPVSGYKAPIYEDGDIENYIPDPRRMDLAERQQFAKQAKQESKNIMENYNISTKRQSQRVESANDRAERSGAEGEADGIKLA